MLQIIWDTRGYFFWLLVVSLTCWTLERISPWRSDQKAFRHQFGQDLFWRAHIGLNGINGSHRSHPFGMEAAARAQEGGQSPNGDPKAR
jgi:hypothetical protein